MIRVLVTGAAGFVGANVLHELTQRPDITPLALVRPNGDHSRLRHSSKISVSFVDLAEAADVTEAIGKLRPDIVINAAAYGVLPGQTDAAQSIAINLHAVETLLAACHSIGVRRFVQLGSYFEYGDQEAILHEDGPLAPKTAYAETKVAASRLVSGLGDIDAVVLRLFNVWGHWEAETRLVPQIISACRTDTPLALTSGTQRRDFLFSGDAAAWICDIALRDHSLPYRIVNLASGDMVSVRDFATSVADTLRCRHLLQFGAKSLRAGEPLSGPADTTRITALLPNRRRTPLKIALANVMGKTQP